MLIVAVEKGILNSHKNINDSFSKNCKKVKQKAVNLNDFFFSLCALET